MTQRPTRIYAFFAKHVEDSINVHGEAQQVMHNMAMSPWWNNFELDLFVLATFDDFRACMRICPTRNVGVVYVGGHAGKGAVLRFNRDNTGSEMEMLGPKFVAPCIAKSSKGVSENGTVECAVLNACFTRLLGLALREQGVLCVVCWHGEVEDQIAQKFAQEFFQELASSPTNYKAAFEAGQLEVERYDAQAARGLCYLSDEFEVDVRGDDADSMQGVGGGDDASHHDQGRGARAEECEGDGESGGADAGHKISRMVNNDKGRAEFKGFRALGFRLTYYRNDIERGIEMYESSALDGKDLAKYGLVESGCDLWRGAARVAGKKLLMMHVEALRHVFEDESISRYQDLWKENGVIDRRAREVDKAAREAAVGHFNGSLQVRARQLAKHPGGADAGHQQMRDEMGKCIRRIEALVREDRQRRALKMEQVGLPCLARATRVRVCMAWCMRLSLLSIHAH
jgi:hypothetical protein